MTAYFYEKKQKSEPYLAVPNFLLDDVKYKHLSSGAKLLYGSMLRRVDLSRRNKWLDDLGRVYLFYPIKEVMAFLNCCKQKAVDTLRELEGADLVERRNQGRGKPARVLLKSPHVSCEPAHSGSIYEELLSQNPVF